MSPTESDDLKLSKLLRCKVENLGAKTARLFEPLQASDPARLARVFRFAYHAASLGAQMHRTGKEVLTWEVYAKAVVRWCDDEALHVCLNATKDLPAGSSLPPLCEEDCWTGYLSCGEELSPKAILPRLLRGVGHHLAGRLLVDEDQEGMADLFVTVAMGVLTALEAGRVSLEHPIVLAAQKLLEEGRGS